MKKSFITILVLFIGSLLFSVQRDLPAAPDYEFSTAPTVLGYTYYGYANGGFRSNPMTIQPDATNTGFDAGGTYIVYHYQETQTGNSKIRCSYINDNGIQSFFIDNLPESEGFPAITMDNESANPIISFHKQDSGYIDPFLTIDDYNLNGEPDSFLNSPYQVIDSEELIGSGAIGESQGLIYPVVKIGPSPYQDKKRIYISAESIPYIYAPQSAVLAYADVTTEDISGGSPSEWEWNYNIIPIEPDNNIRAFYSMAVKDNYVVYFGYYFSQTGELNGKNLFAMVNDNYGQGDFEIYHFNYSLQWQLNDPLNLDGTWLYGGNQPAELTWSIFLTTHFNTAFIDENTVGFPGAMAIEHFQNEYWSFNPQMGHIPVFLFSFNIQTHQFKAENVYPQALVSGISTPLPPWDLNGDGEVDAYDNEGHPKTVASLPVFYTNLEDSYNTGLFNMSVSSDFNYKTIVWEDCYEAYLNSIGIEGYENWQHKAKIMIGTNFGNLWNTPIIIDANQDDEHYNSAVEGMIPEYVYTSEEIRLNNQNLPKIPLFFLNADEYEASAGGNLEYAVINITALHTSDNNVSETSEIELQNYPNPFNPETTINYQLKENGSVELNVYNIKGQLVKTLVKKYQKTGDHNVVWNGTDNSGNRLASGIYFYKIKQGKFTSTKKMILMK